MARGALGAGPDRIERLFGRLPKRAPGASYRAALDCGIQVGRDQIRKAADRIAAIRGKRQPAVDAKPSAVP